MSTEFLRQVLTLKGKVPHQSNPYIESALKLIEDYYELTPEGNVIGAIGDVVFEVSSKKVETLKDLKRQARGRYATHEIVGRKSVIEFLGLEPDEITFTMQLNADLGVNIQTEIAKLLDMVRTGEENYLIVGGRALGEGQWSITEMSYKVDYTDGWGEPTLVTVELTLKERI